MDNDRFEKLTDRQKHYLRLALTRANSGEIARTEAQRGVAVSKAAIDKVFKQVIERLGVTSRFEAARLFAEHEYRMGVRRSDLPTADLSPAVPAVTSLPPSQDRSEDTHGELTIAVEDVGIRYTPSFAPVIPSTDPAGSGDTGAAWGRVWRSLLITLGLALAAIALGNVYAEISR